MELVFLLSFLSVTHSAKHSLTYLITTSSGLQAFPEFILTGEVDGAEVGYCDSVVRRAEGRQDWTRQMNEENPQNLQARTHNCIVHYNLSKADVESIKQHFNQTQGLHVLQEAASCEWDDQTGSVAGYQQLIYDGEAFVSLDLQNRTWLYAEQAASYKQKWDTNNTRLNSNYNILINICPQWLRLFYYYGNRSLERRAPPSVSLLQTSPSSPVSCYATGFYPDRAEMFWRKDGEQIHEDVDQGEILPNHDGTFQMRVDLDILLFTPTDWATYECVFQLTGVNDDIITRLDKAVIRTNWVPPSKVPVTVGVGVVVGLMLLIVGVAGLFIWRKRRSGAIMCKLCCQHTASDSLGESSVSDSTELPEKCVTGCELQANEPSFRKQQHH